MQSRDSRVSSLLSNNNQLREEDRLAAHAGATINLHPMTTPRLPVTLSRLGTGPWNKSGHSSEEGSEREREIKGGREGPRVTAGRRGTRDR